ncbi:MAG: immunoglobulin domain-containing protein [Phycisphaerae bacterium]
MRRAIPAVFLTGLLFAPDSDAAIRVIRGGVVSLTMEDFIGDGSTVTIDSPAEPAEGFDIGLLVLGNSTFAINLADGVFAGFRDSRLDTEGGISVRVPGIPVSIGFLDFSFIWDAEHEPEEFYLFGHFTVLPFLDMRLPFADFTIDEVVYDDETGQLVVPEFELFVSREFAEDVFGTPDMAGLPFGRARMDLSMYAPNGDVEGDTDIDPDDYLVYAGCVSGPGGGIGDTPCRSFDFDDDGDVDLPDFGGLQRAFTGTLYVLEVRSEGTSAIETQVSPVDFFGDGNGVTRFRRSYFPGTVVTLSVPPDTLLTEFVRWRADGPELAGGVTEIELTIVEPTTATAVYVSVTSQLAVTSTGVAGVPISVSIEDVFGEADGLTDFVRTYHDDTEVTLSTPLESGNRFFARWTVDGVEGAVAETAATVTVADNMTADARYQPIVVYEPPESLEVCMGDPAAFSVVAVGNALRYQWMLDDIPISGATSQTLAIAQSGVDDAGTYSVVVSNDLASVTSDNAFLGVITDVPVISLPPSGADICPGGAVFMLVFANGGRLSHQWFKDGELIPGATGAFFSTSPAQPEDSGVYTVEIFNACGSVLSPEAIIDVDESHCP